MNNAFLNAAASYYGINPEQLRTADWRNDGGVMVVTFEFTVGDGDLIGVMDRMRNQREATQGVGGRAVQHVDVEQEEESTMPAAVWVSDADLDRSQVGLASGTRVTERGPEYLLQVDFLTEEQRAKFGGGWV